MSDLRQPRPKTLPRPRTAAALALLALLAACTTVERPPEKKPVPETAFTAVSWEETGDADARGWSEALSAFRRSCRTIAANPAWAAPCRAADAADPAAAQTFFRTAFTPWRVEAPAGDALTDTGLMTGYYEPLLKGSRVKTGRFAHPIYGVPDDLLVIDLGEQHPELKGLRLRGRLEGRRVVPYDQRSAIQERGDMARWAIAWADDPVDVFFLQIQGSGRVELPDGSFMRVGYADQNGWKYRSISGWLVQHEGLKPSELSMQRIRAWAKAHPEKVKEALAQNPSFIFFEERSGDPALGPVGAQGVALTPGASVAVDPKRWRLGTPFIVATEQDRPALSFTRPVVAQDTGGAIKGVLRFDYFWGFGDEAGSAAGRQKSRVKAWVLVPAGLTPEDVIPAGARKVK